MPPYVYPHQPKEATVSTNKNLKFYSPDGTPIRVCLPHGGVAIVTDEPRTLPPAFYKAAMREGCLTTDMPSADRLKGPEVPISAEPFQRRAAIKGAIERAFNMDEGAEGFEDAFTAAGLPNINWLSRELGFTVERPERDEMWREVQAEAEADDARKAELGGGDNGNDDHTNLNIS